MKNILFVAFGLLLSFVVIVLVDVAMGTTAPKSPTAPPAGTQPVEPPLPSFKVQ